MNALARGLASMLVIAMLGCSSSDDDVGGRAGEACSRGATNAECDLCARTECRTRYRASFHDPQSSLGDPQAAGACVDQGRCIAHCPCGDTACYDLCPPSVACSASIFRLRSCEAVLCPVECGAALEGVGGPCIDLLRCCGDARMPESFRASCRNTVADGDVPTCESAHREYRFPYAYCD